MVIELERKVHSLEDGIAKQETTLQLSDAISAKTGEFSSKMQEENMFKMKSLHDEVNDICFFVVICLYDDLIVCLQLVLQRGAL